MIQQTAVEWLLYNLVYHNLVDNSPKSKLWELTEHAKQMEKEQITKAASIVLWHNSSNSTETAEQYYNETYENK